MTNSTSLRLGIFVTAALVLFIYALLRISDGIDLFKRTLPVYVDFRDVQGLQVGNTVRFAGVAIGEVDAITIQDDTTLRVGLSLDASARTFLHRDALIDIATDGLVGNRIVTVQPGPGKAAPITAGDILMGQPKQELAGMLDALSATNLTLAALADNLLAISEKMNTGPGTVSALLNDSTLATDLRGSARQVRQTTQALQQSARTVDRLLAAAGRGEGNLGYLLQDDGLQGQVEQLGDRLDTLLRVRTDPIVDDLHLTAASLNASASSLEDLMDRLATEDGLVNTLTGDTLAADHLRAVLANLAAGTEKFDTNMLALQHNWFFRGYFRRQAKKARKASNTE
ncbi:hypothetical protein LEM8419_01826 [Neolewinella maritima]|uniref:Mce/MlaD domain-containing protein n=1 Tax=Neolewinella maritima TaxID=1383882 RepID=A0ABM9B0S3_9BACT|nr:MlaD family protein [Neolewinella maritima]CAH1000692.1 hypothetical protein LEM8419_01826 [Neolewinella maritima]